MKDRSANFIHVALARWLHGYNINYCKEMLFVTRQFKTGIE